MKDTRKNRLTLNVISSLLSQIVTVICGLIIPRLLLRTFGSEIYGATTSITQFLSYIALIEGGIGGVARAELYKPLANGDTADISIIMKAIKKFFFKIGIIFIAYVLVIAVSFKSISSLEVLNWTDTFFLVIVISISTLAQYFIGISYGILLQADQRNYIISFTSILTTVLNTFFIILLIYFNGNIILVKLISSCIFILRPLIYLLYVKRHFKLNSKVSLGTNQQVLKNKWVGFGQHIAYFIHSNTDIVLLTVLSNLKNVAVYSVYYLITSNMQSFVSSLGSGMEGLFGEMYAKSEDENLKKTFTKFELLLNYVAIIIFGTTSAMMIPFIRLYTSGITDTEYIYPLFGILMVFCSYFYIVRLPYYNMVIAAGKFKETNLASYGEAVINILLSIALVFFFGIIGVAIGTLVSVVFRYIYYIIYVNKNLVRRDRKQIIKILLVNSFLFIIVSIFGCVIFSSFYMENYLIWVAFSIASFLTILLIASLVYYFLFKEYFVLFIQMLKSKILRR